MSAPKTKNFFYRNSLSLVFLLLFLVAIFAQAFYGWKEYNQERTTENAPVVSFGSYIGSGHFISATFENFESEFLQMALYVLLTIGLRQVGSAESKSLDQKEEVDRTPKPSPDAPWPVRKGGWILKLYSSSLSIVFGILFLASWSMHLYGSWRDQNTENLIKHQPLISIGNFLMEPRFWFETFQNWQSEFLSVLGIVFLSIYLRQKGSPESKPVDAPHMETGK
jgi:O-antigen ligase